MKARYKHKGLLSRGRSQTASRGPSSTSGRRTTRGTHSLRYASVASTRSNGSLGTLPKGITARLWQSSRLTFGRTLCAPLLLLRLIHATLLLTSKRSWMYSAAHRLAYPKNTVLGSICEEPTSEEPTFKEPTSKKPTSKKSTSKEST